MSKGEHFCSGRLVMLTGDETKLETHILRCQARKLCKMNTCFLYLLFGVDFFFSVEIIYITGRINSLLAKVSPRGVKK